MIKRNIFRSAAILTLFALFTSSCINNDKSVGSGFAPGEYQLKIETATFDIPVQMKMADSLQTIYSGAVIVGGHKDDVLGETSSFGAFEIVPSTTDNSFGDNPQVNYIKFAMAVGNKVVLKEADASIPQNIYIYRLRKTIDSTQAYNNSFSSSDYDPTPLNQPTIYTGGDSVVCKLSTAFANELLSATQQERDSIEIFLKRFKGLVITTDPLPGSINGGRFNIITPESIYIMMSYKHKESAKNIDKDSLLLYYSTSKRGHVNTFKHSSKNLESTNPQNDIYIEGLAGIKPYIDFAQVKTIMQNWATANSVNLSRVIISRAELRFPFDYPGDYKGFSVYPNQVFLAKRELNTTSKNILYQPLVDVNYSGSGGTIDKSNLVYSLNITSFLQSIIKGTADAASMKTWLLPLSSQINYYTGAVSYFVDNGTYFKGKLNGNAKVRKPQLVLTYAVLP